MTISLCPVNINDQAHLLALYKLLEVRSNNISHLEMPSFEEHCEFVKNNSYVGWYLAKRNGEIFGSCYVTQENAIGLNCVFRDSVELKKALDCLLKLHAPLPERKSTRRGFFTTNVSPSNHLLSSQLQELGGHLIQNTFEIPTTLI